MNFVTKYNRLFMFRRVLKPGYGVRLKVVYFIITFLELLSIQVSFGNDNLYFIHRTNSLPLPEMKVGGVRYYATDLATPHPVVIPYRMTLHWTLSDAKPNRGFQNSETLEVKEVKVEDHSDRYIVIESFKKLSKYILGGWITDFYMIGPYTLSNESVLIAPIEEINCPEFKNYPGQVIFYSKDSSANSALISHLQSKRAKIEFISFYTGTLSESRLIPMLKQLNNSAEYIRLLENMNLYDALELKNTPSNKCQFSIRISKSRVNEEASYIVRDDYWNCSQALCTYSQNNISGNPFRTLVSIMPVIKSIEERTLTYHLEELFPKAPFLLRNHPSSLFTALELAIKASDWSKASQLLTQIRESLEKSEMSTENFDKFVKDLKSATGQDFSKSTSSLAESSSVSH